MGTVVLEEVIDARAFQTLKEANVGTLATEMEIEMDSTVDGIDYLRIYSK